MESIVDFLGHELVHMGSNLAEMLQQADCSLEQVSNDFNISYLRLRLAIPQESFRRIRQDREQIQDFLETLASPALEAFDDARLSYVTISPMLKPDPSWRGGVEQPVVVTEKQEDAIWKHPGLLRLFLSHKSDQKDALRHVKLQLLRYGIDSFLAHEEIKPTKPWAKVIQHGLQTCDALLAVGTSGFHASAYCMQEVGWALGRGILVLPILAGEEPAGFHNADQGQTVVLSNATDAAKRIVLALCEDARMKPRILGGIARRLQDAPNGSATWAIWQAFEDVAPCPDSHADEIIKAMEGNPEAMKSTHAVPRFREWKKQVRPPSRNLAAFAPAVTPPTTDEYDPFADE